MLNTDTKENVTWYYGIGVNKELKREVGKTKLDILGMEGTLASILASYLQLGIRCCGICPHPL